LPVHFGLPAVNRGAVTVHLRLCSQCHARLRIVANPESEAVPRPFPQGCL
jgi:hypothetical protein